MALMRGTIGELYDVMRASTPTHLHLRSRIGAIIGVSVVVDVLGTVAIYFAERNGTGGAIHTVGDALFFTTTQLLTVSSQMPNPVTGWGRFVDVLLEAYGITVIATLAGSFGAFFHRRSQERHTAENDG